ncbi:MAG: protein BatD [Deltaproteobacteria bacterium]|nr:protein BatD [Deltaproteobacteria bacterium]
MRGIMMALALLLILPPSLLAAQVTAVADRDRLAAGDSLQLELRVTGSPDDDPDLDVLKRDWEILNRSQSSQIELINGSFSRSLVLSLSLMPRRSGELEIPAICFGADCSLPLPITVSEQTATTTAAAPLLLEAEAQPRQVPVGAQILLTVRLLHRVELRQASLSEPRTDGVEADIQRLGKDRRSTTRRNGYLYQVIERRYVIFPRQAGQLSIPALQLDAQVDTGSSRGNFFARQLRQLRRSSKALQIQVTPPPADLGSRNWLPARQLTLQDDWQQHPPTLRVGEPATRTLTLTATGLPAASLPELKLPVPAGWKSYPDQPSRQDTDSQQGIIGTLQQKIALVPTRPGSVVLPAIDLDWFDVTTAAWKHIHLKPLQLKVAPAATGTAVSPPPQPLMTPPATPPSPTAAPAPAPQNKPSTVAATAGSTRRNFWPWLSLVLGLGWLATLLLRQRRRSTATVAKDPTTADEKQETEQTARKAVFAAAGRNDPQATRQALLRWSRLRATKITGDEYEELKRGAGAPLAAALSELDEVLYSKSPAAWNGEALCAALADLPEKPRKTRQSLPPLYPATELPTKNG